MYGVSRHYLNTKIISEDEIKLLETFLNNIKTSLH